MCKKSSRVVLLVIMGDLIPIIEGPAKIREGKKVKQIIISITDSCFIFFNLIYYFIIFQWKNRFACVTRLSPVAGKIISLTFYNFFLNQKGFAVSF